MDSCGVLGDVIVWDKETYDNLVLSHRMDKSGSIHDVERREWSRFLDRLDPANRRVLELHGLHLRHPDPQTRTCRNDHPHWALAAK